MEVDAAAREMEAEIEKSIRARIPDFKKKADSLTLEGVRRELEKDMGLDAYSLDAHKKFIKQCVDKVFHDSDDEDINSNASEMAEARGDHLSKEGSEDVRAMPASKKLSSSADEQAVRSSETEKDPNGEGQASGSNIDEDMIKEAINERASYFRENSETLTLQGVRRTLEEDLKLVKKSLDAYKNFITTELDRVLQEPANGTKKSSKQGPRKDADQKSSKTSKRAREDETSENDSQSGMEDSDEDSRPRKRGSEKVQAMKRQKKARDEKKLSTPKAKKVAKQDSDRSTEEQDGNSEEEDNTRSSAEQDNKKKQPAPAYGKQVEHLRSIIKSCGMSVPPSVYRRAKQAPENKRDAWLIKELEDILEKEGLSKNPSEKEIKAVKKRKERAKELEGIDMSNIITSSRRRNTSNFIPLPPPKVVADSDDDDDEDDAENDEDDDEEIVEGADESDNDDAEGDDGSADDSEED